MAYQHSKDRTLTTKDSGEDDPYLFLLSKLSGVTCSKPRKPHAFDLWATENQDVFTSAMQGAVAEQQPTRFQLAGLRTKIKKAEFEKLSDEVKVEWQTKAKEKQEEAMREWKSRKESGPSTTPEDRQRYVALFVVSRTAV